MLLLRYGTNFCIRHLVAFLTHALTAGCAYHLPNLEQYLYPKPNGYPLGPQLYFYSRHSLYHSQEMSSISKDAHFLLKDCELTKAKLSMKTQSMSPLPEDMLTILDNLIKVI